ncbi:L-ascorbate metabolism protein UlaG (beta-lactamase superfamily) [Paenibacillus phyllosphaerae]|uniref:L-ascorbate metabolism protein UlaG (Beta-lactamase superfamily) n=1 Tax=Paenibacillus phyllosphaerae TaxID=274593 RepID=A0A7W5FKP7_9BACL|nr:MBL fold metallo-hydrolase [Paenibacillus phyllosphaerae]MBB3108194.1 L-ascorbate metabolism protein UlaG (beta-lactamase superfamily) [Paenibacillus phyllosphaerae]
MKVTLIRNATLVVEYAGKKFLVDPFLADKDTYPPFPNALRQDRSNPLASLPIPVDTIIDVDAVIVTHLHVDHFDDKAKEALPKMIPMFVQNEEDAKEVRNAGFLNVEILAAHSRFEDIQLIQTKGEHGRGEILQRTGNVCGVILKHAEERTLYVAGDTVWYEGVREAIEVYKPEVIVVNGGDNQFLQGGSLVMGKDDIYHVYQASPDSIIISVHMEAVNHWTLSRTELKSFLAEKGISSSVLVPEDGDSYML